MEDFLNVVLWPSLYAFLGILATKVFDWVKTKTQVKSDIADVKSKEIDNEIKSAEFYRGLLDDATKRLDRAILAIEERDIRIAERDKKIMERDARIDTLLDEVEILTTEIRKYKQLNGKQE